MDVPATVISSNDQGKGELATSLKLKLNTHAHITTASAVNRPAKNQRPKQSQIAVMPT